MLFLDPTKVPNKACLTSFSFCCDSKNTYDMLTFKRVHFVFFWGGVQTSLTLFGLQSRFGGKPIKFSLRFPLNVTAGRKGSGEELQKTKVEPLRWHRSQNQPPPPCMVMRPRPCMICSTPPPSPRSAARSATRMWHHFAASDREEGAIAAGHDVHLCCLLARRTYGIVPSDARIALFRLQYFLTGSAPNLDQLVYLPVMITSLLLLDM